MNGRLAGLSAYALHVPLERPLPLANQTITARDYVIAEAVDEDGRVGRAIGYSRGAPVHAVIRQMIAPSWQTHDLATYPDLYDATVSRNAMQGSHGIFWRALSLADCAVHDLMAMRAGVPLSRYLGASPAPVKTTLAGCYPVANETPATLAALMTRMAEYRASGVKVTGSGHLARDTERLRLCRAALPAGVPLIIDLYNAAPPTRELAAIASTWAELGMGWLEDPYGFDELQELAALAQRLPYPVGVGDEQAGLAHFRNLIDFGRIGVVRLDATACGGVTGFLRIAAMATGRGLPVSCHVFHHLHAHLAAAVPGTAVEYMLPETGVDAIDRLLDEDLEWDEGRLVPSSRPGVGYVWNEPSLRRFRQPE
ncbi:MAG TPA: enolase C-terminal domain-like protein [Bauldia sp.]|nr:enolase C-terminal domain-like protein [Bauldia sp.]